MTEEQQQKPAILLIDDAPLILDLLEDILEILDYPVLRLEVGSAVNRVLDQEKIALVFVMLLCPISMVSMCCV